jgi:hypothetical protein
MTTATLTDRPASADPGYWAEPSRIEAITAFSVDVVDGNGLPVSYQEVAAQYRYVNAPSHQTVASTDTDGRVRFTDHHPEPPLDVTLVSGREQSGPHLLRQDLFIIEM